MSDSAPQGPPPPYTDQSAMPPAKPARHAKSALDKVDEDSTMDFSSNTKKPPANVEHYSYHGNYGVRNYMHNFYSYGAVKDPEMYEDDDLRLLLNPRPRRRSCGSIWWKVFVWIGANFLVFGIIGVLVGYLVPQKPIIIGSIAQNVEVIDRDAISYNFNLDVCKLVGLILFCIGGLTLTVALLFPSFLSTYCDPDEERPRASDDSDCIYSSTYQSCSAGMDPAPASPIDKKVPLDGRLAAVQPSRHEAEATVTQGNLVSLGQ